ncbi:protein PLASTID MOVEMENT IMPAIRED 1-RELATED 1-like [Silene latifolia]|uniref:protein PLASTID MOVEMENT IMPAIRED 1-RELATED 1-like n=1 Tax=Silene latifolia TaxID=37657 RepID=UPI003D76AF8B
MMSRDAASSSSKDQNSGKLVDKLEIISKTFNLNKNLSRSSSSSSRNRFMSVDKAKVYNLNTKHVNDDLTTKDKKKSIWKTLKAFSNVKHRRFKCCFTLTVHSIEGLPSKFNHLGICVHWERNKAEVVTNPIQVNAGVAEIEQTLTHTCSVSGSANGRHHSVKYEAKPFLLYATIDGNPKLDFGKHHVNLTKLLPFTLEELEDGKSLGTWETSFKLLGEAKGAAMNVTFGYELVGEGTAPDNKNVLQLLDSKATTNNFVNCNRGEAKNFIHRSGSLPTSSIPPMTSRSMDGINILPEVPPIRTEFSNSVKIMYQKFDEDQVDSPIDVKHEIMGPADCCESVKQSHGSPSGPSLGHLLSEREDTDFLFPVKRLDLKEKPELDESGANIDDGEEEKSREDTKVHDDAGNTFYGEGNSKRNEVIHNCNSEVKDIGSKESLLEDLESVLGHVSELEKEGMDTPEARSETSDQDNQISDNDLVSLSFNAYLEPESPRERLLREFLQEAEASGCSLIGSDVDDDDIQDFDCYAPDISEWEEFPEDYDSLPVDELEYPKIRAKVMEELETQEHMEDWGYDEKGFQCSPPHGSGETCSTCSPIYLPPQESSLPSLGDGLGPIIQTKSGGFLRSMNPGLFRNAKSAGILIMQISRLVVVPSELGSSVMDVLQHLASMGLEKLSDQAKKMLPLEDITGNTVQDMAWEDGPQWAASKRQTSLQFEQEDDQSTCIDEKRVRGSSCSPKAYKWSSSPVANDGDSEYVSIEDLAPSAMDKIEELSIEGLRIQSSMSDEDAPSTIIARSTGKLSALEGKRAPKTSSMGLEGAAGLQLLGLTDGETDANDGDELMSLSLTLDEWMRLDSGEIDKDQPSKRTSKLLMAHNAKSTDLNFLHGKQGEGFRKCGLLGNNLTVAFMVQLRDPSRDFEPIGTPMLALIQVERTFVPSKPRVYYTVGVAEAMDYNDKDNKEETEMEPQEVKTQFKISEVHVAGLEAEPRTRELWGNAAQQQSGSCWLLANGMGKGNNKNPIMKPNIVSKYPLPASISSQAGDTLWSISSRYNGKGLGALNPHTRNPNIILSNETIRLR